MPEQTPRRKPPARSEGEQTGPATTQPATGLGATQDPAARTGDQSRTSEASGARAGARSGDQKSGEKPTQKSDQKSDEKSDERQQLEEAAQEALAGQAIAQPVARHYGQSVQDDTDRALSQPPPPVKPLQKLADLEAADKAAEQNKRDRDDDNDDDDGEAQKDARIGQQHPGAGDADTVSFDDGSTYRVEDGVIKERTN